MLTDCHLRGHRLVSDKIMMCIQYFQRKKPWGQPLKPIVAVEPLYPNRSSEMFSNRKPIGVL